MQRGPYEPLEDAYKSILRDYLRDGDETRLSAAHEIGRRALHAGYGLIGLMSVHYTALVACLREDSNTARIAQKASAAGRVLLESAAPFSVPRDEAASDGESLRRMNASFEEAADRLAHALHDEASQLLSVVYLELSLLRDEVPASAYQRIDRIKDFLDQTYEQLRHLSHELRPPLLEQHGLIFALEYLVAGFERRSDIPITLHAPERLQRLPRPVELAFYRSVQEALTNVSRHARASRAEVTLAVSDGEIVCTVEDDGVGFNADSASSSSREGGLGLAGIRARVEALRGSFAIAAASGRGTRLHIGVPLPD